MKKTLTLVVLVLMMTLAVVPAFAQTVEIRVAWWGDTSRNNMYNEILDRFEKAYPGIKTVREPLSWQDYWQKLMVQSAGGAAPDFMGMHPQYANDYLRRGVVEPLDTYIDQGIIDVSDIPQGAINTGVVDGVTYMLPMGLTGQSFFVNKTMLEENGLEVPDFNWTWDDLREFGLKGRTALDAAGKRNVWICDDNSKNYQMFRYWIRQEGNELYTVKGDLDFAAEQVAAWWSYWKDLRDTGICPDAATSIEYGPATLENSLFARQKVAMRGVPANQYTLYVDVLPENEVVMLRNPSKVGHMVGEYVEGAHFAISSRSTPEKKVAAAKLMDFWLNTEESYELFGLDQGVPANTKMAEFITTTLNDVQIRVLEYVGVISELASDSIPTTYPPAGASELDSLFQSFAEQVMYDAMTPDAAAREFVAQAEAVIESNR